jgi:uncharacterized protein with FMN-binding domain
MKKAITALVGAVAALNPVAALASAATPKKHVTTTTKTVSGPQAEASRWGFVQVTLIVKKTTTTIGTRKKVTRKITKVSVPVYPDHTDRSVFINEQAIPMLIQEEMSAQFSGNLQLIGGATDTSYAFGNSLQAALLAAKKV